MLETAQKIDHRRSRAEVLESIEYSLIESALPEVLDLVENGYLESKDVNVLRICLLCTFEDLLATILAVFEGLKESYIERTLGSLAFYLPKRLSLQLFKFSTTLFEHIKYERHNVDITCNLPLYSGSSGFISKTRKAVKLVRLSKY